MPHRQTVAVPLVSVVLIFLNEERFLEDAVRSVREQTLADWELILVDDGSTDRSTAIARDLARADERIRYVDHPGHDNRGTGASRNFGVAHTTAPYIAFIDGDDVWLPSKLAEQVELLESKPDVAMVSGAMLLWHSWDPASTTADTVALAAGTADRPFDPPVAALKLISVGSGSCGGISLLVRRRVFEAVGGFEERFRGFFEDRTLLIKVYLRYTVYMSSRVWIFYRQHDASCCAQITSTSDLHMQGVFLDWLQEDAERLKNPRVAAAIRRARQQLFWERLKDRIPDRYKDPVRRLLRRAPREGALIAG